MVTSLIGKDAAVSRGYGWVCVNHFVVSRDKILVSDLEEI